MSEQGGSGAGPSGRQPAASTEALLATRRRVYGFNTSLSYESPLHIVRGQGAYLWDAQGERYLDGVNNVCHLGHCHPKVVDAVAAQLRTLNTNSRYLHPGLGAYSQELAATLPAPLEVVYMVNSGSEANDLALRMARAARPGATHVAVMAGAYHGHTSELIALSPYKFWGPGGAGKPDHVHVIPAPDPYRGENLDGRRAAQAVVAAARAAGGRLCAFFCESVLSCGGQVVLPPGYLEDVYEVMRGEGAVCVADEVQVGFGRVGSAMWAFQTQGVVPDMVTLGKPIANGYPVAALVTTPQLARSFANGMEYFNTFGGSTASTAAARATLSVLQEEGWQAHAHEVGQYLMAALRALQPQFPLLGDVRGLGLMVGIDVVRGPCSKVHAPRTARWIKERMRAHRVLISTDGPYDNVLKLKPPLPFSRGDVDLLVRVLRHVLAHELTPAVCEALEQEEEEHWARVYGPRLALYRRNETRLSALLLEVQQRGYAQRSRM